MTASTWTLAIPGRGTIFLYEAENQSEFVKEAALPALTLGKEWNEPWTFVTTVGPQPDQRGLIVGGTDEFMGITGTFVEVTHLRRFSKRGTSSAPSSCSSRTASRPGRPWPYWSRCDGLDGGRGRVDVY